MFNRKNTLTSIFLEISIYTTLTILLIGFIFLSLPSLLLASTKFEGKLESVNITVNDDSNQAPIVDVSYVQDGLNVNFDASASNDTDGTIQDFIWDFGDGTQGKGEQIQHTYSSEDDFSVTVTAIDDANGITLYQLSVSTFLNRILESQTISTESTTNISVSKSCGQGFISTEEGSIKTIIIKTGTNIYGQPPVKIRVGTKKDMSIDYIAESEGVIITDTNTEYEFNFKTPLTISANQPYFFSLSVTNDLSSNYLNFATSSSDSYIPDGCNDCKLHYKNSQKWDIDGLQYNKDLYFKVIQ